MCVCVRMCYRETNYVRTNIEYCPDKMLIASPVGHFEDIFSYFFLYFDIFDGNDFINFILFHYCRARTVYIDVCSRARNSIKTSFKAMVLKCIFFLIITSNYYFDLIHDVCKESNNDDMPYLPTTDHACAR